MSTSADASQVANETFFRCPVPAESCNARLRIGRRRVDVVVQDTSIDGFTILVSARATSKLKMGVPWLLSYDGTRVETSAQWFYHAPDGTTQVGLRRLRDLTPATPITTWSLIPRRARNDLTHSGLVYTGFLLALFLMLALPGIGDSLGTAGRIQKAVRWMFQGFSTEVSHWL